jgi:hypothetical protein
MYVWSPGLGLFNRPSRRPRLDNVERLSANEVARLRTNAATPSDMKIQCSLVGNSLRKFYSIVSVLIVSLIFFLCFRENLRSTLHYKKKKKKKKKNLRLIVAGIGELPGAQAFERHSLKLGILPPIASGQ